MREFIYKIQKQDNATKICESIISWLTDEYRNDYYVRAEIVNEISTRIKQVLLYKSCIAKFSFYPFSDRVKAVEMIAMIRKVRNLLKIEIAESVVRFIPDKHIESKFWILTDADEESLLRSISPARYARYKSFIVYHTLRNKYKNFMIPDRTHECIYRNAETITEILSGKLLFLIRDDYISICSSERYIIIEDVKIRENGQNLKNYFENHMGVPFNTENPDKFIHDIEKAVILKNL